MKVIWYNSKLEAYQYGNYTQFTEALQKQPKQIIGLERLYNISEDLVDKIVTNLNKGSKKGMYS